jgi:hypothetical protein
VSDVTEPGASVDEPDTALVAVVREIERHAAEQGWDQPARLFAVVPTADLLAREPGLASALGVDASEPTDSLTPVEQDSVPADHPLEDVLTGIMWPAEVFGCAAVVERLVLPPSVEELPEDPAEAAEVAAGHPDRQEVRIVAAATRDGGRFCAMRLRSHDDDLSVLEGPDLVPNLLQLLTSTLDQ